MLIKWAFFLFEPRSHWGLLATKVSQRGSFSKVSPQGNITVSLGRMNNPAIVSRLILHNDVEIRVSSRSSLSLVKTNKQKTTPKYETMK
jgi:hypothetical protein